MFMELENLKEERKAFLKQKLKINNLIKKNKKLGKPTESEEISLESILSQIENIDKCIYEIKHPKIYCDLCGKELPTKKNSKCKKCPVCRLKAFKNSISDCARHIIEYRGDHRDAVFINDTYRSIANDIYDYTCNRGYAICDITHTQSKSEKIGPVMYEHIFGRDKSSKYILDKTIEMGPENITMEILQDFLLKCSIVVRIQKYERQHTLFNDWIEAFQRGNTNIDSYNEGLTRFGFNLIPEEHREKFILI